MEVHPLSVQAIVEVIRANKIIKKRKTKTDRMTLKGN